MRTSGHIANVKAWVYHVYSVCTLLKVFGNYDLSVLSRSVMGFQKKFGWLGGWGELYPILSGFLEIFKLCKAPVFLQLTCNMVKKYLQIGYHAVFVIE